MYTYIGADCSEFFIHARKFACCHWSFCGKLGQRHTHAHTESGNNITACYCLFTFENLYTKNSWSLLTYKAGCRAVTAKQINTKLLQTIQVLYITFMYVDVYIEVYLVSLVYKINRIQSCCLSTVVHKTFETYFCIYDCISVT